MCLDAVVNGRASAATAAPAAVGPMRFSLCRRVVYCYDGMVIQQGRASAAPAAVGPSYAVQSMSSCCLLLRWYGNSIVYSFSSIYIH